VRRDGPLVRLRAALRAAVGRLPEVVAARCATAALVPEPREAGFAEWPLRDEDRQRGGDCGEGPVRDGDQAGGDAVGVDGGEAVEAGPAAVGSVEYFRPSRRPVDVHVSDVRVFPHPFAGPKLLER